MAESEEKIVIIDGNSLVNRAYYAIQRPMITSTGFYTQGIYGFLNMLSKIMKDYAPTHMLVAYDRKAPTFRHLEFADYKAGRRKMPEELAMELPVLKEVLDAMGIRQFEIDGFEADDIIGTTAKMAEDAGMPAVIITGDRDALQLATDTTSVVITKKGISEFKLYDDAAMMEEYGFDHKAFIDYKALRGDPSDNIPGIPGVGDKTATQLIQQFGSIEALIAGVDKVASAKLREKIEENAMSAVMSKRLATIVTNVPVDYSIDDCRIKDEDTDRLIDIYTRLEFRTKLASLKAKKPAASDGQKSPVSEENGAKRVFPQAEQINGREEAEKLLRGLPESVVIDIDSDDSHIHAPKVGCVSLYYDGKAYDISGVDRLGQLLADCLSGRTLKLTGFHLGRLYYVLLCYGCDISNITADFDCAIAQYVLSPSSSAPGLEAMFMAEFHESLQAPEQQMSLLSDQPQSDSGKKLALLAELRTRQEERIESEGLGTVLYEIELPLCKVLASMEHDGITVDREELESLGKMLKAGAAKLEAEIKDLAGEDFNVNSPAQLGPILFEKLGLPAGKKTKKGYSTSADVLEKLAPEHPIVAKILEYRTLSKLASTYVDGMLPLIADDGRIHCHFQQTVTATGRISCTEPNLQNIPVRREPGRQLRRAFTADDAGHVLIGADYSQIELRVLAHMSKDPTLIECFNEGLDIHRETASKVFGVPQDEVTPLMRSAAKAVNFGVIYGMSGFGLASDLNISRKQAEQYIKDYFERFPGVRAYMDNCVASCKRDGSIRTLYGRKRSVPEIHASQFMVRQLGERLAMNTPIQGTAADIIKIAMIRVYDALKAECPGAKLILQIHDELIIHADKRDEEKVSALLTRCMEDAAKLAVKLEVSRSSSDNWYDLK